MKLLPISTWFVGVDREMLRSTIPWTVESTTARLLPVFGSATGVSTEVSVAVLVITPGASVWMTIVWVMAALLVIVPRLKVTRPASVDQFPAEEETERMGRFVGN